MFITLTDWEGKPLLIQPLKIVALKSSEYTNCTTALVLGANPEGELNVQETIGEIENIITEFLLKKNMERAPTFMDRAEFEASRKFREFKETRGFETHPLVVAVAEENSIIDQSFHDRLTQELNCTVSISNKGMCWVVSFGKYRCNYYPTIERFQSNKMASFNGRGKSLFLNKLKELGVF